MSYFVVLSCGLVLCVVFVPVLCPDSLWLLFYNSKYQALAAAPKQFRPIFLTFIQGKHNNEDGHY